LSPHTPPPTPALKALWVLVAALFSLVVALMAGLLVSTTEVALAEAILYGGGAFAVCMTLCLGVLTAVGVFKDAPRAEHPPRPAWYRWA
jgi:hypothetical protein